ncbi:MAG TPA: C25 family cysteine peptidase, partial [Phycisphaerae bacterium]|nr:C25 family cysteine peptidase [Phycisphaerae bacterium]
MSWKTAVLAVVLITSSAAADLWVSTPSGGPVAVQAGPDRAPSLAVEDQGQTGFDVTLTTEGLAVEPSQTKGGEFVRIQWPGASITGEVGSPAIPVIRRLFVVPNGATVAVNAAVGEPVTLDSSFLNTPLRVIPVQPPVEKVPGALERAQFQLNEAAYEVSASVPEERVTAMEGGIARGQRLFLLEARPVAYNAAEQRLTVWPEMKIQVRFSGQQAGSSGLNPLPGLRSIVLNPEMLPMVSPRGTGNYLIVAAPAYVSAIASFASAKQAQGFTVATHQAEGTKEAIKAYIQSLWGGANSPDYILLVGDTDTIPMWTGGGEGSPSTDLQYACMDGASDWYPDIAIGRFSAQNATQLQNIVTKTLLFENGPVPDPTYFKRAVFMASNDNYTVSEGTHNWVISNYLLADGFTCLKLYCHTYGATPAQVTAAFNDGQFYGIYSGHGSETYWADGPVYYQSDVNALTNLGKYPLIYSFACLTGTLTVSECFMETWQRAQDKGGVIAIGASVTSYWTEDDVMEKKLFVSRYDPNDAVVSEVGPVWNDAKMRYMAEMGSGATTRRYFEMYNILGDPALAMTGEVEPLTGLKVMPKDGYAPGGPVGGPFTPASKVYTLTNKNSTPLSYSVTKAQPWLTITNGSGTLPALGTADVTVTANTAAGSLAHGNYGDTINFINLTDHDGDTTRAVTLQVGGAGWDPVATGKTVSASAYTPTDIDLNATDPNGDPLTFEIEVLPAAGQGILIDPGTGQQITAVPYTLVNGGRVVRYVPPFGQTLSTTFTFAAWDATARSNLAVVVVNV